MKGVWQAGALLGLAALVSAGCGGPGVATSKVSGKVTVAGQPVQGIKVIFTPESGRPANGITDASGNFTLSSFSKDDGAMPGKYTVAFGVDSSGEPPSSDPAAMNKGPTLPFNPKYQSASTSGITAEVVAGKDNVMPTWDLEK